MSTEVTNEGNGSLAEATEGFIATMGVTEPSEENPESVEAESEELVEEQIEDSDDVELVSGTDEDEVEAEPEELKYFLPLGEDGSDVEISKEDVNNYVLMQSDYTKKTQALAEERKALEQERNSIRAIQNLSEQLQAEYEGIRQAQEADRTQEYWETLKEENPMQYMIERQDWQDQLREREVQQQKIFALQQQMQEQQNLERQHKLVNEAQKLQELIPTWSDQATADKEKQELLAYGRTQQYSNEELNSVMDARAINILRKSMLYDRLVENKKNLKQKALNTPASASTVRNAEAPKKRMSEFKKAQLKLHKTGKLTDATDAFHQLLLSQDRR